MVSLSSWDKNRWAPAWPGLTLQTLHPASPRGGHCFLPEPTPALGSALMAEWGAWGECLSVDVSMCANTTSPKPNPGVSSPVVKAALSETLDSGQLPPGIQVPQAELLAMSPLLTPPPHPPLGPLNFGSKMLLKRINSVNVPRLRGAGTGDCTC